MALLLNCIKEKKKNTYRVRYPPSTTYTTYRVRYPPSNTYRVRLAHSKALPGAHFSLMLIRTVIPCADGVKTVNRESSAPFKPVIPRELAHQRPGRLDIILDMPPASRETQVKHAWNPEDRSLNIFVKVSGILAFLCLYYYFYFCSASVEK